MLNVISKSILAYTLSVSIAFAPSLALARTSRGVKSHGFQAEPTAKWEREQAAKPQRKVASKKSPQRRIASVMAMPAVYPTQGQAIGSMYHRLKFKGQDVLVAQTPTKDGKHVLSQTIQGPDFQEVIADEYGTGTASRWSLKHGNVEMTASHPFNGSFARVDIRERRAKSYITTRLQLNPDFRTYRAVSYRIDPFHVDRDVAQVQNEVNSQAQGHDHAHQQGDVKHGDKSGLIETPANRSTRGLIYECENQVTYRNGIVDLQKILDDYNANHQSPHDALTCTLESLGNAFFDKTCFDQKNFPNSAKDMADALADIFSSVNQTPSKYLQCANDHHFAFYAARMQANFMGKYNEAMRRLSDAQKTAMASAVPPNCPVIANGTLANGTEKPFADMTVDEFGAYKQFKCDNTIRTDGAFHDDNSQQIDLGMDAADMIKTYSNNGKTKGVTAKAAYASVMFHELLHQSGIPEEPQEVGEQVVAELQNCCANPDQSGVAAACNKVEQRYAQQLLRQQNQDNMDMYLPGSLMMQTQTAAMLGTAGADDLMGQWYSSLTQDPEANAAWQRLQTCEQAENANRAACVAEAAPALRKFNDNWFRANGNCDAYKDANRLGGTLKCHNLRTAFDRDLSSDMTKLDQEAAGNTPAHAISVGSENVITTDSLLVRSNLIQFDTINLLPPVNLDTLRIQTANIQLPDPALPTDTQPALVATTKTNRQNGGGTTTTTPQNTARVGAGTTQPQNQGGTTVARNNQGGARTNVTIGDDPGTTNNQGSSNGQGTTNGQTDQGNSQGSTSVDAGTDQPSALTASGSTQVPYVAPAQRALSSSRSTGTLVDPSSGRPASYNTNTANPVTNTITTTLPTAVASAYVNAVSAGASGAALTDTLAGNIAKAAPALAPLVRGAGRAPAGATLPVQVNNASGGAVAARRSASLSDSTGGGGSTDRQAAAQAQAAASPESDSPTERAPQPAQAAAVPVVAREVASAPTVGEKVLALKGLGEQGFRNELLLGESSTVIGPLVDSRLPETKRWRIVDTAMGKRLKPPGNGNTCYEPDRSRGLRAASCANRPSR